ncbi:hypothetical protein AgCh_036381 [Apium graveolens]
MMNNHQKPPQFPQPTKPVYAQDTSVVDDHYDPQPQNYYYYNYSDSDEEKYEDHKFLKKLHAKVEEEIMSLKTSIKDGDVERNKVLGLFKKFGAKLNKKMTKHSENDGVNIQERGIVDIEVDQKLERFKVKTVNLGTGGDQGDDADHDVPKK